MNDGIRSSDRYRALMIAPNDKSVTETLACLIIDDPLLRPQYGFLDYRKLLQEMKEHDFFTEIAFIPWNWRRSEGETVRLLRDNPEYFGICVHGCNHTSNEFGLRDYHSLSALSSAALWSMEQLKSLTGLSYDPVMVFPQGRFSSIAMLALKDQGYRAAFSSTLRASDGNEPPSIEYQRPATTIYHGFPLFLRRYPKDRSGFLGDLASGRPIIVVDHHGAFKGGYRAMTDLVDWVNDLGNIRWVSLGEIADRYCGPVGSLPRPLKSVLKNQRRVAFRRYLCEFRDNCVESSDLLGKLWKMVRDKIIRDKKETM